MRKSKNIGKAVLVIFSIISLNVRNVDAKTNDIQNRIVVSILDNKNEKKWIYYISEKTNNDIYRKAYLNDHEGYIELNLTKYMVSTFTKSELLAATSHSGYAVNESDITLRTGLKWNVSGDQVKLTYATGSVKNKGLFYAGKKTVNWRNPGSGKSDRFYPSTQSWSQSLKDQYGFYSSSIPPYSILDVVVHVSGMSSTKTLSVKFDLNNIYS